MANPLKLVTLTATARSSTATYDSRRDGTSATGRTAWWFRRANLPLDRRLSLRRPSKAREGTEGFPVASMCDAYRHLPGDACRADGPPRAALSGCGGRRVTISRGATISCSALREGKIATRRARGARASRAARTLHHDQRPPTMRRRSPIPGMVLHAMSEAGVAAHDTVVVGETVYDIAMARAAGAAAIGVTWGYHPRDALAAPARMRLIDSFPRARDRACPKSGHREPQEKRHSATVWFIAVHALTIALASLAWKLSRFFRLSHGISRSIGWYFSMAAFSRSKSNVSPKIASCAARRAPRAKIG